MVVVSYSGKEINAKLVYYGMGLSGKTTNLEKIYETVPDTSRGKMVSMKTQSDRTLFFDLLPIDLGEVMGFKTRFLLYTVPGQVFYNATRKLVLKGADAIVFVADSERGKMDENKESLSNLRANLAEYKVNLDDLPWVIQYNKRDLPDVYSIEELERELNPGGVPHSEAVATQSQGVMETFELISKMLIERVTSDLKRQPGGGSREIAKSASRAPAVPPPPAKADRAPEPEPVAAAAPATARAGAPVAPGPARADVWETSAGPAPSYGREVELPGDGPPSRSGASGGGSGAPSGATGGRVVTAQASSDGQSMVVPVRLAAGQKLREIVLRIVIEQDEAA